MKLKRFTVLCTALTLTGAAMAPAVASEDGHHLLAKRLREAIVAQNLKDVIDLTPPAAGTARVAGQAAGQREKYDQSPAELMNRAQARTVAVAAAGKPLHQTPNMDAAIIE